MRIEEAGKILGQMYESAAKGEKAVSVHLFGIDYADHIGDIPAHKIAVEAGLPESYGTEISKGIKLADYVQRQTGTRSMTIDEAAQILADMYTGAKDGETAVMVHLFAIKYADRIRNMPLRELTEKAGIKKSWGTEIRKGINLAKYVEPRMP